MQRGKKFWYKNGKFLIKYRIREYGWKKCPTGKSAQLFLEGVEHG